MKKYCWYCRAEPNVVICVSDWVVGRRRHNSTLCHAAAFVLAAGCVSSLTKKLYFVALPLPAGEQFSTRFLSKVFHLPCSFPINSFRISCSQMIVICFCELKFHFHFSVCVGSDNCDGCSQVWRIQSMVGLLDCASSACGIITKSSQFIPNLICFRDNT